MPADIPQYPCIADGACNCISCQNVSGRGFSPVIWQRSRSRFQAVCPEDTNAETEQSETNPQQSRRTLRFLKDE
jgi:hypothetical protein